MGAAIPPPYPPGFTELTGWDLLLALAIVIVPAIILWFWLTIERYVNTRRKTPSAEH